MKITGVVARSLYMLSGIFLPVDLANLSFSLKVISYLLMANFFIFTECRGRSSALVELLGLPISNDPAGIHTISGPLPPLFKASVNAFSSFVTTVASGTGAGSGSGSVTGSSAVTAGSGSAAAGSISSTEGSSVTSSGSTSVAISSSGSAGGILVVSGSRVVVGAFSLPHMKKPPITTAMMTAAAMTIIRPVFFLGPVLSSLGVTTGSGGTGGSGTDSASSSGSSISSGSSALSSVNSTVVFSLVAGALSLPRVSVMSSSSTSSSVLAAALAWIALSIILMIRTVVLSCFGDSASSTAFSNASTHSLGDSDQSLYWMILPSLSVSIPSLQMIILSPCFNCRGEVGQSISAISTPVMALISIFLARPGSGSTGVPALDMASRKPP